MSQPKAFLLTGGRLYSERVVLSEAGAITDCAQRNDGSTIVPLHVLPPSPCYSKGVTTWMARFNDALALLCGSQPEPSLTEAWVAHESEDLQEWALNQCPLPWAMGIAVIEAAEHLADHPEEGVGHAPRPGAFAAPSPVTLESARIQELEAWCRSAYPLIAAVGLDPIPQRRQESLRLIESMPVTLD